MRLKSVFILFFLLSIGLVQSQVSFVAKATKKTLGINEQLQVDFEMNQDGRNFDNQFLGVVNPFKLEIFKTAVCCFRFQKNHNNNNGSNNNNQNICGFTNSKLLLILFSFFLE